MPPAVREQRAAAANRLTPLGFVLAFGVVSLLADFVYEGARSIVGPFLASLGAGAGLVGFVTGAGEAVAVVFRLGTGLLADRTRRYWAITIAGYAITVASVPLLALTAPLWLACGLVITERFGKAVRTPARDAMLSHAGARLGQGWAFALHEAMDQTGALAGPLLVAGVLALGGGLRLGFAVLAVPGVLVMVAVLALRAAVPAPEVYEGEPGPHAPAPARLDGLGRRFWLYALFTAITMTGFATFAVLAYHLQVRHVVGEATIPVIYALAMGLAAVFALASGRLYDRAGLRGLVYVPVLAAVVPFLSFSTTPALVWAGAAAWGAVLGVHESTMRAAVADLVDVGRRATGYGVFNAVYGLAWLLGSGAVGVLYGHSVGAVRAFTVAVEVLALASFVPLALGAGSPGGPAGAAQGPGR